MAMEHRRNHALIQKALILARPVITQNDVQSLFVR